MRSISILIEHTDHVVNSSNVYNQIRNGALCFDNCIVFDDATNS